jgi:hypothetical protein
MAVREPKTAYTMPPPMMAGTPQKTRIANRLLISMIINPEFYLVRSFSLWDGPICLQGNQRPSRTTEYGCCATGRPQSIVVPFISNCLECKAKKRAVTRMPPPLTPLIEASIWRSMRDPHAHGNSLIMVAAWIILGGTMRSAPGCSRPT